MRGLRRIAPVCLCVVAWLAAGCAATPGLYRVHSPQATIVFPPAPETARYQLLGHLVGESNFVKPDGAQRPYLLRAWLWFVGLALGEELPYTLARPQVGVVDEINGRIYVCDTGRASIAVFDRAEGRFYHWDDATERQRFKTPVGISMGPRAEIWVSDAELGYVVRLDMSGKPLGSVGQGNLKHPVGLAWDASAREMFIADAALHSIVVVDEHGRELRRFGKHGEADGEFNAPTHLALNKGELLVSDSLNSRVQRFDTLGKWHSTLGRRGMYIGDLPRPKGVAVDQEGRVYVVESYYDYLLVYDHENRLLLAIGGSGSGGGQFSLPAGVWTDSSGKVYVADMYNGRVAVFQYLGDATVTPVPTPNASKVP